MKASLQTRTLLSLALALAAAIPFSRAHGTLTGITFGGQDGTPGIRAVSTGDPVKGATTDAMSCGTGAKPAPQTAQAKSGDEVSFHWENEEGGPWVHDHGPMLTYMASCGSSCEQFDASGAKWFKVDQAGLNPDGTWVQAELPKGKDYSFKLPAALAPGDYLIRHEIIALQLAQQPGGAEFYPRCTQVKVSGSGTAKPAKTVSFPGAYSDKDPGILVDVFGGGITAQSYKFPGPQVDPLAGGGGGGANSGGNSSSSADGSASTPAPSQTRGSRSKSSSSRSHARTRTSSDQGGAATSTAESESDGPTATVPLDDPESTGLPDESASEVPLDSETMSASDPGLSASDPGASASDPGASASDPGPSASDPGPSVSDPGPSASISDPGPSASDPGPSESDGPSATATATNESPLPSESTGPVDDVEDGGDDGDDGGDGVETRRRRRREFASRILGKRGLISM